MGFMLMFVRRILIIIYANIASWKNSDPVCKVAWRLYSVFDRKYLENEETHTKILKQTFLDYSLNFKRS